MTNTRPAPTYPVVETDANGRQYVKGYFTTSQIFAQEPPPVCIPPEEQYRRALLYPELVVALEECRDALNGAGGMRGAAESATDLLAKCKAE
jgi:hypothetical protein